MPDFAGELASHHVKYGPASNAAYIRLSSATVLESEEVSPGVVFDFDAEGHIVGIELLDAKTQLSAGTADACRLMRTEIGSRLSPYGGGSGNCRAKRQHNAPASRQGHAQHPNPFATTTKTARNCGQAISRRADRWRMGTSARSVGL